MFWQTLRWRLRGGKKVYREIQRFWSFVNGESSDGFRAEMLRPAAAAAAAATGLGSARAGSPGATHQSRGEHVLRDAPSRDMYVYKLVNYEAY